MTTSTFPRWEGDPTARFVRDLAELATPAWDITVLAPHHPGARTTERVGALDVQRFAYFLPRSQQRLCYGGGILPNARSSVLAAAQLPALVFAEMSATRSALRRTPYTLVHAHFLVPQGWVAAQVLRASRVPLVVSVHGSDLLALNGPLARAVQRGALARADLVTVNSEATAHALAARFPHVLAPIITLPMGYDPAVFSAAGREAARRLGLLYVGRLSRQKGADVLVEAFAHVLTRVPDATLTLVGDGPERPRLLALVRTLGLEPRITFLGALAQEHLPRLYRESACTVVPSRADASGEEGQGLAAIEAMACGCPVVASRSGGLTSLLDDDARGLLVPPGDSGALAAALHSVLGDPASARRRALAAAQHVRAHFAWPALQPTLLATYDEAIRRRTARC